MPRGFTGRAVLAAPCPGGALAGLSWVLSPLRPMDEAFGLRAARCSIEPCGGGSRVRVL